MGKKESLIKNIRQFKLKANKEFKIAKLLLFGSQARGTATKESDIDLIVISKQFKNIVQRKRATKMYDYWDALKPVDFLCYTPDEFNKAKKKNSFIAESAKTAVEI